MTTRRTNQQRRDKSMAFAMAVVLAVTLAGAWMLVRAKNAPVRHGAELIDQLAEEGLDAWWKGPELQIWGIFPKGQREPEGWTIQVRTANPEGGFAGMTVGGESSRMLSWQQWTLNNSAREGIYEAGKLVSTRTGPSLYVDTRIEQRADGKLLVRQFINQLNRRVETSTRTPENYAPEGTLQLLRERVGQTRRDSDFRVIVNSAGPAGQEPNFIPFVYEYSGQADLEGQAVQIVQSRQVLRDDSGGQYSRIVDHLIDPERGEVRREQQIVHYSGQVVQEWSERLLPLKEALDDPQARAVFVRAMQIAKQRNLPNLESLEQIRAESLERPFQPDGDGQEE
ncbi:MAG: hypothetical protein ACLFUJ_13180 [Phycisphaerae bacterium]